MKLDWAILSNAAETNNGLTYMLGAGWDVANRPQYPAPFMGTLTIRLLMTKQETLHAHKVQVELVDEDGHSVMPPLAIETPAGLPVPPGLAPGQPINQIFNFNFGNVMIPKAGTYTLEVMVDGASVKSLPCVFKQAQPQPVAG